MEAHNVYRAFQNQTGPPPRREPTRPLPNIACEECRRKKTRCDMRRPACSLCVRIGEDCNYPPRRRSGRKQKHATTQSTAWGLRPSKLGSSLSQQRVPPASNSSSSLSLHHSMHTSSNNLPALDENSFADPVAAFGPTVPMDPIDSQFGADLLPYNVGFAEDYNYRDDAAADEFARWLDVEALSTRSPFTGARTYAEGQSLGMPPLASSSGLPHGPGPSTWTTISTPSDSSSKIQLDIPRTLAIELIELFFQRVHCFLPIFTRRVFDARYGDLIADEAQSICTVSCESAMILHSIFGLSARYSNTTILAADDRGNRGTQFVTQAMKIYSQTHDQERDNESKFTYLTGLILLTFSTLQTGPSQLAWDMRKDCVRLAHDLDLSNADQDIIYGSADPNAMTWDEWNSREERRRLWWIVWDLDTFMSAVSATPFAIEEPPTHIFLPIPDRAWDKNERVVSVPMSSDVMSTCESLCRSPNQSEWAWFLVCTAVMRQIVAAVSEPTTDERVMKDTEATLTCFALALPEKFQLDAESLNFDETSFEASNWVLNTAILLQWLVHASSCSMMMQIWTMLIDSAVDPS